MLAKCNFANNKVEYFELVIGQDRIIVNSKNTEVAAKWIRLNDMNKLH